MIVRSFESAANGMLALMDMNDNTANNLANVNTIGYKKGSLRFKDVMQSAVYSQEGSIIRNMNENNYLGSLSVGSQSMQYTHDFSQGGQLLFLLFPFQQTHYHLLSKVQRPLPAEKREQL